jgi:hypothetical protein
VANASREDLQKLLMDSLKKLKTRDKRIAEMTAASEKAAAEHAQSAELAESSPDKNTAQELQVSSSSSLPFVMLNVQVVSQDGLPHTVANDSAGIHGRTS